MIAATAIPIPRPACAPVVIVVRLMNRFVVGKGDAELLAMK